MTTETITAAAVEDGDVLLWAGAALRVTGTALALGMADGESATCIWTEGHPEIRLPAADLVTVQRLTAGDLEIWLPRTAQGGDQA